MADVFSKDERTAIMRNVKSKSNKSTEQKLIDIFKAKGIKGWRRNYPVKGKPDFIFPKQRIAIFTDGCFWHGHNCRNITPKQNAEYWTAKRQRNIERDKKVTQYFEQRGWTVLRFWECDIKRGNLNLTNLISQRTKAHTLRGCKTRIN